MNLKKANSSFIIIDKPLGVSSFECLKFFKKDYKKVGHSGTLDPYASGVLVVGVNRATKFFQYLPKQKRYLFDVEFGYRSKTDDLEGEIIEQNGIIPSYEDLLNILNCFVGEYEQIPTKFSALKVNGRRAYELAREGVNFELKSRIVEIYYLQLLNFEQGIASFDVICSQGTYIRTLAADIARKLNVFGCVVKLRRTFSDGFDLSLLDTEIHLECFKNFYPSKIFYDTDIKKLKNGQFIENKVGLSNVICIFNIQNEFCGLGFCEFEKILPLCML